ncbi:hypothetical protein NIES2104_65990 [Leptolyngbya sp. NIES-2104]|nr:hypothetical protein NIES2104_65990 [Leptolyngbya sp. NIES-2104]
MIYPFQSPVELLEALYAMPAVAGELNTAIRSTRADADD